MPTNALLVRWNGGWLEALHPDWVAQGRKEGFLSVGAAQSAEEGLALGMGQVTDFGKVREGVEVETDPADDAVPYLTYDNGDTVMIAGSDLTPRPTRVTSIAMVEDDDGEILWAPSAGDLLIGEDEVFDALSGQAKTALRRSGPRGPQAWPGRW
jgi:hypothetical protein